MMLRVDGSLFFGAVDHVRDVIDTLRQRKPQSPYLLLIGSGMNFIDVAGADLLVDEAKRTREIGGELFLCNLKAPVVDLLKRGGVLNVIGRDHVFRTEDEALRAIEARIARAK